MSEPKKPAGKGKAKRKKKGKGAGPFQHPLRIDDPRLVEAIDRCKTGLRRSRNLTIVILIEEALKARGDWPPPSPSAAKPPST